ncbi:MAG: sulfatase-like hydrolase/transferase, partial [Deltaproteobacteria bacterium]|nr:sulfatase-like hydrolase/transferase [Deltaproteobacteria bacterium]
PPYFLGSGQGLNVVVLLLESVSNISRQRGSEDSMPNFTSLKERGVYWPNFYAVQPNSLKSIFSFLSGYYPAADSSQISRVQPRIPIKLLPAYFKERGYRTAFLHSGTFAYYNKLAFLESRGFDLLLDANSLPGQERYEHSSWGIDDRAVFDFAAAWALEDKVPFLAVISLLLPHHPYDIPAGEPSKFGKQSMIDKYHSSLYYLDGLLGEFVEALKAGSIYEDTVFVIFADHGEAFGQHPHNFMHGAAIYEENINVPLLISSPKLFDSAQVSMTVGSLPDILPTLCDLMGIKLEGTPLDGVSLFSPHPKRMVFMSTHLNQDILGLRDGDYKFIYQPLRNIDELYNLRLDPSEQENLAPQFPERVKFYRERAQAWAAYSTS